MNLQNPVVLGVGFAALAVIGVVVMTVVGRQARTNTIAEYSRYAATLCEPLGLTLLPSPSIHLPRYACVGSYEGADVLMFYVPTRLRAAQSEPRVDLLLNTGLLPGLKGSVNNFVEGESVLGEDGAVLKGYVSDSVRAEARSLPKPCLMGMANLMKGSVLDLTIRERWKDGWSSVAILASLPVDSRADDIRVALDQMLRVRAALAQEIP